MSLSLLVALALMIHTPAQEPALAPNPGAPDAQVQPKHRPRLSSAVLAKMVVHHVDPHYPISAQQQHMEGAVVLRVLIDRDGKVEEAMPMSGPDIFRQPAVDAVKKWQYKPYVLNGTAVGIESTVTINFHSF